MQIFIKSNNTEEVLTIGTDMASLRGEIFNATLISEDCQVLTHNGQLLESLESLQDMDTIFVAEEVLGGGAKHKKKVYTTKKKNKHRHIKEKLATLRVFFLFSITLLMEAEKSLETERNAPTVAKVTSWPDIWIVTTVANAT